MDQAVTEVGHVVRFWMHEEGRGNEVCFWNHSGGTEEKENEQSRRIPRFAA